MRTWVVRLCVVAVLLMGALAAVAVPVRADSGDPFSPGDGRVNPLTGDRLAIYCNNDNLDVWGIDSNEQGFHLTAFSLPELQGTKAVTHLTENGVVTLKLDSPAQTHWANASFDATVQSLFVDVSAVYHVAWTGGSFGANGQGAFYKVVPCTYLP